MEKLFIKPRSVLSYTLIIFLLFIHLGVNEFFSFMFLGFLILLVGTIYQGISTKAIIFSGILFVIQFLGLLLRSGEFDLHLMLSLSRETVVYFILLNILVRASSRKEKHVVYARFIFKVTFWVVALNAMVVLLQIFDSLILKSGIFDLPESYYALRFGTLPSQIREEYISYGLYLRPSSFYSEPSALGLVGVICFIIGMKLRATKIMFLSLFLVISSMSLSAFVTLSVVWVLNNLKRIQVFHVVSFCLVLIVLYMMSADRINKVFEGEDGSTYIRMVVGLEIMDQFFSEGRYFGVSEDEANMVGNSLTGRDDVLDNHIYYKIIIFGILGAFFLLSFYLFLGREIFTYLFLFGFFNGTLFYYDRLMLLLPLFVIMSLSWKGGIIMKKYHE